MDTEAAGTPATRIVAGYDGSTGSCRALDWAVAEAQLRRARLEVVTCWQFPLLPAPMAVGSIEMQVTTDLLARTDLLVARARDRIPEGHPGSMFRTGIEAELVIETIERARTDLAPARGGAPASPASAEDSSGGSRRAREPRERRESAAAGRADALVHAARGYLGHGRLCAQYNRKRGGAA